MRATFAGKPYVSLEDPDVRDNALAAPRAFLALYPGGAVLDEAQHAPQLFSYLQTRVDEDRHRGQSPGAWVLTGSQHFGLEAAITQSLAGRVGLLHLLPLSLGELQDGTHPAADAPLAELLWRGLYPPVVDRGVPPAVWHADYVATYIERDLRQLIKVRDLSPFRTFMRMCAARSGQMLNLSALAADCGVATNAAKAWLSVLEASYIVFTLPQHHVNLGKRLVKSPKLYFYDSGLAAWLAGVRTADELALSSLRGPLFETWAQGEVLKARCNRRLEPSLHDWRDKSGVEVDLLLDHGAMLTPVEFKAGQAVAADLADAVSRYRVLATQRGAGGPAIAPAELAYGGTEPRTRGGVQITPWRGWPQRAMGLLAEPVST